MKADKYRFDGSKKFNMGKMPTDASKDKVDKEEILKKTAENKEKMSELQNTLYAEGKEGIVFVIQSLDASGKDSLIRHTCDTLNPQGIYACSFKAPSQEDLSHDYLWRVFKALPRRGSIAIFNRSHYEDAVTVKIYHQKDTFSMADRVLSDSDEEFFSGNRDFVRE